MKLVLRLWMLVGAIGMLLLGCSPPGASSSLEGMQSLNHSPTSPVIALDVTEEGLLKVAGFPETGSIQALSLPLERKIVLLGESFVERHGMISTKWDLPSQTMGSLGEKPLVALVRGEAGAWVQQRTAGIAEHWLVELVRLGGQLEPFQRYPEGRLKDRILPIVDRPEGGEVRIQAAAMSGRTPGIVLTEEELQLLACLDGRTAQIKTLEREELIRCKVQWSSNGELQAPKLIAKVVADRQIKDDVGLGGKTASGGLEELLSLSLNGLLQRLQAHKSDPLDIGRAVRGQYRGVWTPERWHDAFTRADLHVNVRVRS